MRPGFDSATAFSHEGRFAFSTCVNTDFNLTCVKSSPWHLRQIGSVTTREKVMTEKQNARQPHGTRVYACSGSSDTGELADRIARQLTREGAAEMSCLAGIGGRVKSLLHQAEAAERILAIDGCPLNCTRHTLELAGFKNLEHLELHTLGFRKNACPVTGDAIAVGVQAARKILTDGSFAWASP